MKLGIKMRGHEWLDYDWDEVEFNTVEVHAHFAEREDYDGLFAHLRNRAGIRVGMHYDWPIDGRDVPTFAVDDQPLRERTIADLREAIDYAARRDVNYLLYHAGPRQAWRVGADAHYSPLAPATPEARSAALFLDVAAGLVDEAARKGVALVVESETELKPRVLGRTTPGELVGLGEQSPETILALARTGAPICVDFANLTTTFAARGHTTRKALFDRLADFCRQVMPASALVVHVVGVRPPFIQDTRSGLTDFDLEFGAFPDRTETAALLAIMGGHADAVAIPEGDPRNAPWHNRLLARMLA